MASKIVGNLIVNLAADVADFRSDMKKAATTAERQSDKINRSLKSVKKRLKGFADTTTLAAGAFAAAFAGRSIINATMQMERINSALKFATGSSEAAANEFNFVTQQAERLGLELTSAAQTYAQLTAAAKGTSIQGQETRDIFVAIAEAGTVLGLTGEQMRGALRSIEQMISKGNVQAEELRGQLGERLPGAFQIAARAMNMTTQELNDALESGEVMADDMLPKLAEELHKTFGPSVQSAANNTQQEINRFKNALFNLKVQLGEGGITSGFTTVIEKVGSFLSSIDGAIIAVIGSFDKFFTTIGYGWDVFTTKMVGQFTIAVGKLPAIIRKPIADIFQFFSDVIKKMQGLVESLPDLAKAIPGINAASALISSVDTEGLAKMAENMETGAFTAKDLKAQLAGLREEYIKTIDIIEKTSLAMFMDAEGFNTNIGPAVEESNTGNNQTQQAMMDYQEYANFLKDSGVDITSSANKTAGAWAEAWGSRFEGLKTKAGSMFNFMQEAAAGAARSMQSHLADFFYNFDGDVKDMVKGFIDAVRRMIAEILAFQTLKATLGQFEMFAGFFQARATGGPVQAGQPYLVGERGPELIVPSSSGTVIPNNKMGGQSVTVNMPVDARGAMSPEQIQMTVQAAEQRIYYNLPRVLNGYAPV